MERHGCKPARQISEQTDEFRLLILVSAKDTGPHLSGTDTDRGGAALVTPMTLVTDMTLVVTLVARVGNICDVACVGTDDQRCR